MPIHATHAEHFKRRKKDPTSGGGGKHDDAGVLSRTHLLRANEKVIILRAPNQ